MDCTYMSANDGIEELEKYQPGGLHPIYLGDKLEGRYKIVHKLGFGGSSTVWLAHDETLDRFVAIKVPMAEMFECATQEISIQQHIASFSGTSTQPSIARLLDNFIIEGPNGKHLSLVFELAGPSFQTLRPWIKVRPDHCRRMCLQIAEGIASLHRQEIAFGDLSTANILFKFKDVSSWTMQDVTKKLGQPREDPVRIVTKREVPKEQAPRVAYHHVDYREIDLDVVAPEITLVDLTEAVYMQDKQSGTHDDGPSPVNPPYASPEHIFLINQRHTKQSDIWSLAACFIELRSNKELLQGDAAEWTQDLLGPMPQQWLDAKKGDAEFEEMIIPSDDLVDTSKRLSTRLQEIGELAKWHHMSLEERRAWITTKFKNFLSAPDLNIEGQIEILPPPPAKLSDEEFSDFYDLLSRMLRYLPEERMTIEEVLEHPWLHKTYDDGDLSEPWLCRFDWGRHDVEDEEDTKDPVKDDRVNADDQKDANKFTDLVYDSEGEAFWDAKESSEQGDRVDAGAEKDSDNCTGLMFDSDGEAFWNAKEYQSA